MRSQGFKWSKGVRSLTLSVARIACSFVGAIALKLMSDRMFLVQASA